MKNKPVPQNYLARLMADDHANHPVVIVPGDVSPHQTGDSYGWEKIRGPHAGERVSAAYAKKWCGNVQYVGSTITVEVGERWIAARRNRAEYHTADGVTCVLLVGRVRRGPKKIRVIPGWMNKGERIFVALRGRRSYHATRNISIGKFDRATAEKIASEAAASWARQDAAPRLAREQAASEAAFRRDLPTTMVSLADSRAAGNCVEGSLNFAERKLGLSRAEILDAGHLFAVPASRLLAVANGDLPRVEAAIRIAWARETTVSI